MINNGIFYEFMPNDKLYLIDTKKNKFIDFTSGNGFFPAGFSPEISNLYPGIAQKSELSLFSEKLSEFTNENYNFYFYNSKENMLNALSSLIQGRLINCEPSLESYFPNSVDFFQKSCIECDEGPDELTCSNHCKGFLKDFINIFSLKEKITFLCPYFILREKLGRIPIPVLKFLKEIKAPWICYEHIYSLFRMGSLFSFSQSDYYPEFIIGGNNLSFGIPLFYLGINKKHLKNSNIFSDSPISSISLDLAKKTLNTLKATDIKEKISIFSSELSSNIGSRYELSQLGLTAKIKIIREKLDKFYQKGISYGLLVKIDYTEETVLLAPPLTAENEYIKQGIAIIAEILKDINR